MIEFPELQPPKTTFQRMRIALILLPVFLTLILYSSRIYILGTEMNAKVVRKYYTALSLTGRRLRQTNGGFYSVDAVIEPNGPAIVLNDFTENDWDKIQPNQNIRVKAYKNSAIAIGYSSASLRQGIGAIVLMALLLPFIFFIVNKAQPKRSPSDN
jgi:hypothetical protein